MTLILGERIDNDWHYGQESNDREFTVVHLRTGAVHWVNRVAWEMLRDEVMLVLNGSVKD